MQQLFYMILLKIMLLSCNTNSGQSYTIKTVGNTAPGNPYRTINAIPLPEGFQRTAGDPGSFTEYLRNTGLKKQTTVYLYNGEPKQNQDAQYALLNISIGNKDLQPLSSLRHGADRPLKAPVGEHHEKSTPQGNFR
jgi:hypothetical protein